VVPFDYRFPAEDGLLVVVVGVGTDFGNVQVLHSHNIETDPYSDLLSACSSDVGTGYHFLHCLWVRNSVVLTDYQILHPVAKIDCRLCLVPLVTKL
jgi:hypothetical protein